MRLIFAMLLTLVAASATAEKFYKWVDKDGVTHYTSTPPLNQKASEVKASGSAPKPAEEQAQPAAPDTFPGGADAALADEAQKQAREKNCATARGNLSTLQNSAKVMRIDPTTKKAVEIDDAGRAAALADAEQQVKSFCN